ncbi:transposase IS3/IS911 [Burkholderia pseudomallei]|nr:transposase IS3/IS911 [Burkholderia pseudomallei]
MKKRFTEEQIIGILTEAEAGLKPAELCRKYGIDLPDFFGPFQSWRTASVASVEQYRCLNSSGVR